MSIVLSPDIWVYFQVYWATSQVLTGISKSIHSKIENSISHSKIKWDKNKTKQKTLLNNQHHHALQLLNQKPDCHFGLFTYPHNFTFYEFSKALPFLFSRTLYSAPSRFIFMALLETFYLSCHLNNCKSPLISLHIITLLKGKYAVRMDRKNGKMSTYLWKCAQSP